MKTNPYRDMDMRAYRIIFLWLLLLALFAFSIPVPAAPALLNTITNPSPEVGDGFGSSVVTIGVDQLLVGAPYDHTGATNAGAAYLFSTNGTLLTTFTNPTPAIYEYFGTALAAVGSDRVLIGSPRDDNDGSYAGAVYLFHTNGTLQTTITNPAPSNFDQFGAAVASVGSGLVIIGAPGESRGSSQDGAAYVFDTTGIYGTRLTTITNPIPGPFPYAHFGSSVAAVGGDRVLIGAYQDEPDGIIEDAGVAHLFGIDGRLQKTFTNPDPAQRDYFGWSVAGVGTDRVLIGAYKDDTGAGDAGIAYLFSTDGTLLTSITNPVPLAGDGFGYSVASVKGDQLLIGAPNHYGSIEQLLGGMAYLFGTDGVLVNAVPNPTPSAAPNHRDSFGSSVAASAGGWMAIGAYRDDAGAVDTGSAYLFSLNGIETDPMLSIIPSGASEIMILWTPDSPGFVLQEQSNIASNDWINSPAAVTNSAVVPATMPTKFYRLIKP